MTLTIWNNAIQSVYSNHCKVNNALPFAENLKFTFFVWIVFVTYVANKSSSFAQNTWFFSCSRVLRGCNLHHFKSPFIFPSFVSVCNFFKFPTKILSINLAFQKSFIIHDALCQILSRQQGVHI